MDFEGTPCRIIRSDRRTMEIQICSGDEILFRVPSRATDPDIRRLLAQKADWIRKALSKAAKKEKPSVPLLTPEECRIMTAEARAVIPERVRYHAGRMGLSYGRITLRTQRTRWGSCSGQGNLNFNILLMLAPEGVLDSVVVHELCHLIHHNHSQAFWNEVYRWFPDYDRYHDWLKKNGGYLLARLG